MQDDFMGALVRSRHFLDDFKRMIERAIVADYNLQWRIGLAKSSRYRFADKTLLVVRNQDKRN
jgi:hypothetical protein